eukprot:4848065-Alexandrium_andersonii.AAC.1
MPRSVARRSGAAMLQMSPPPAVRGMARLPRQAQAADERLRARRGPGPRLPHLRGRRLPAGQLQL